MAFPVILVNSATGSDTQASGAGPGTALFGATGITSADGLTVSLLTDNPDLSGVATDGSAVLFMSDTAAGAKNFSKITAVDNGVGVKTVTVALAFGLTNTDAWAIGGKRASIASTTSKKLFDNNGAAGDARGGWVVEMESGHAETIAAAFDQRVPGSTTDGAFVLRGVGATKPILTFSNNGNAFVCRASGSRFEGFTLVNTNATKTASVGFAGATGNMVHFTAIAIAHATNKFWKGYSGSTSETWTWVDCEIGSCASNGLETATGGRVFGSYIHDCGGHGIAMTGTTTAPLYVDWCLITNNTGDGINNAVTGASLFNGALYVSSSIIDGNTSDGIQITEALSAGRGLFGISILNTILSNNGVYGLHFSGASVTAAGLTYAALTIRNVCFYANGTGKYLPTGLDTVGISVDEQTVDPQFTNAAGGDYSIGTNLKALGFPGAGVTAIKGSSTISYVDIGAAQRVCALVVAFVVRQAITLMGVGRI